MREVLFLQCRLDSSRLPGKALLPLEGLTVIERVMQVLKNVSVDEHILLTTDDSLQTLQPLAESWGFEIFAGPKEDVLLRFLQAAEKFQADTIIRATGDNPLVSPSLADSILSEHTAKGAHYSGYLGIPLGTGVEILDRKALEKAFKSSNNPYDREHVSPYLYNHPEEFTLHRPDLSSRYGTDSVKISLDTPEDYQRITAIYHDLFKGSVIEIDTLVDYIHRKGLK